MESQLEQSTSEETINDCDNNVAKMVLNLIDSRDVTAIIESQRNMLARFEKTNEMLVNCNALTEVRYITASNIIKQGSQKLVEIKKDLDYIFKRIRLLKEKIAQKYPEAFQIAMDQLNNTSMDDDEEQVTNK